MQKELTLLVCYGVISNNYHIIYKHGKSVTLSYHKAYRLRMLLNGYMEHWRVTTLWSEHGINTISIMYKLERR